MTAFPGSWLKPPSAHHLREIPVMRVVPVDPPDIVQAEPEQKAFQPELRILHGQPCGVPGSTEVAVRIIVDAQHVDASQVAGSQQARERQGVAAIGLHLVARVLGRERRCDDLARQAPSGQIAMQDVAAGTGLVREHEVRGLPLNAPDQLVEIGLAWPDRADEHGGRRCRPACATETESRWRPRPTKSGVGWAMAGLRFCRRPCVPGAALIRNGPTREWRRRSAASETRGPEVARV